MRAVIINDYGDNTVVSLSEIDRPVPQSDEVLIKVHAAGVNPVDWKIRSGAGQRMGMTLPIHLGSELSGTVVAVGGNVCGFVPGDAVYGIIGCGAFADYAVAKAADMAHKPSRLNFIEAAAVPLGALTAWQAMFDLAELSAGQRLLITSGAGGVGSLAVQLAKAAGAHVTAMASAPKERFVRALGADDFIDYTAQPFDKVARDMDVVFDTVGGEIFGRAFATLKPAGFLVTSVAFPSDEDRLRGVGLARVRCVPNARQLAAIGDLVEAGRLRPQIAAVLPLAAVREALALSEAGRTSGKIVIDVGR